MAAFQGNLGTIRDEVVAKLRLDDTDDVDKAEQWINLAYLDAVQQTGCLQQAGTANLTSGTDSYTLPAEVEWIRALVVGYADGTVSDPCRQVTLEEMLTQRRATRATGQQLVSPIYAIVGQGQLEVWPEPGTGSAIQFWYVYLPDELDSDGDEPLIHEPYGSKLLEYGALVEGARFKKDPLLPDYEAGLAFWMARFQVWLNRREGGSPSTFRVSAGRGGVRLSDRSTDVP